MTNYTADDENNVNTTISWDAHCGCVDFYTFYYVGPYGVECQNVTLDSTITNHTVVNADKMQIAAHRNDLTKCSKGIYVLL